MFIISTTFTNFRYPLYITQINALNDNRHSQNGTDRSHIRQQHGNDEKLLTLW